MTDLVLTRLARERQSEVAASVIDAAHLFRGRWKPGRLACLYLLRDGMSPTFKVGVTIDPKERRSAHLRATGRPCLAYVRQAWMSPVHAFGAEHEVLARVGGAAQSREWVEVDSNAMFDAYDYVVSELRSAGLVCPDQHSSRRTVPLVREGMAQLGLFRRIG